MMPRELSAGDAARLAAALPRIDSMVAELASFEGAPATITCAREFGPFQYEVGALQAEIRGFLDGAAPQSRPADGRQLDAAQQVDEYLRITGIHEVEVGRWRAMVAGPEDRTPNA